MKTILKLFSNFLTLNDFAACTAYGIIAETEGGSKAVVEDVSADKETVERLVQLFESERLKEVSSSNLHAHWLIYIVVYSCSYFACKDITPRQNGSYVL